LKKKNPQGPLALGIDTGGTYTDGILLEYDTRRVLASRKSLTTKRDLSIGVEKVIKGIPIKDPSAIKLVSISTTLATNAIAEGKSKRVALFLIGYDPELIAAFSMEGRFATPRYHYFDGGHDLYGREKEPPDMSAIVAKVNEIKDEVDALAVSSYFSPLNPEHENRIREAISGECDLPIVLGHHLSTKLGSVERATTAALNASLLVVLEEFVKAVRQGMQRRGIDAPLMVVRGDGTLMSEAFASQTPVETIHSGPAASAIGGRFLSALDDALVVDIGGTTTDIALIEKGQVAIDEQGATVNGYKTAVKAARLFTMALGGDSHITLSRGGGIVLGPERVVPLAQLALEYPEIEERFKGVSGQPSPTVSVDWLEYWFLLREPNERSQFKTEKEKALVDILREGPKPLPEILERLKVWHVAQLGAGHLVRQEIIGKAGLTPTDLLHVDGRFAPWNAGVSASALASFCRLHGLDEPDLCRQVWARMTESIVLAIITFLSGKKLPPPRLEDEDMGRWFFNNSLDRAHPHLETQFRLRRPIIGIGAPAGIFLKDVADGLQTDLILPQHFEVANAVGAVAGTVMSSEEVLVYPRMSREGLEITGYYAQNSEERHVFEALRDALDHARAVGRERAVDAAVRSGADNPQVHIEEQIDGLDTYRIRVKAMGSPRLTREDLTRDKSIDISLIRVSQKSP
jgi:N-methylhydantoinase A/oxoprolinase/acetone carboxylase beta subunit